MPKKSEAQRNKTQATARMCHMSLTFITMPRVLGFHRGILLAFLVAVGAASSALPLRAQNVVASTTTGGVEEYKIGPGDVLTITVTDTPEFGGKFRVSDTGVIQMIGLSEPLVAEGLTTIELSQSIRKSLIDAKQLRNPKVNVFIDEYHGRTITVLGSVTKPSVYSLTKRTNVLEALSFAGGALPNSGNTVTVVRGAASAEATGTPVGSVQIVDIARLTHGDDALANIEVRNGDVINVSPAQVIYVVGAVTKPGGFVLSNPTEGISVVQAVALAEGFLPLASTHQGLIIRQSTSEQARREIPVDVEAFMKGQQADLVLAPNDILYIPVSGKKRALKVAGDIAMAAINGVAIYGLGYRIGTSNF
jgi:polysaccharide export outer membrane protein